MSDSSLNWQTKHPEGSQSQQTTEASTPALTGNPFAVEESKTDPNQQQQIPMIAQPKFFQIVDVATEYQKGNFLPVIHCLAYKLIPKDYLDFSGYNVLHHAISYNNIPLIILLLDHFKIDINIRSKNNQTALMIACNYGFTEIISLLCERGALINEQEDTKFSALLYTVKQGWIPHFCYLLYQNADLSIRDANGCTVVHWASYKNNIFLLRLFKRLGLDLNGLDATGLTPIDRAVQGDAFESVEYLLENGDGLMPPNMKFHEIANPDIKEIMRRKYFETKVEKQKRQFFEFLDKNAKVLVFSAYAFLWLLMMVIYKSAVISQSTDIVSTILFLAVSFFSIGYFYWYFMKSHGQLDSIKKFAYQKLHLTLEDKSERNKKDQISLKVGLNFDALNKLLQDDKESVITDIDQEEFPTFLHELAYQFKTKNFRDIGMFDVKNYCPTCLIKRAPRSKHPKQSKTCVSHFHHYSKILKTSINKKNHIFYLLLLLLQGAFMTAFLFGLFSKYSASVVNKRIYFVEIGYHLGVENGVFSSIIYGLVFILICYNSFFLMIELYGLIYNITYNELFNRNKYNYLFQIKQDARAGYVKVFKNPYNTTILANIKDYLSRIV
jgi:ankyrin repeat protein